MVKRQGRKCCVEKEDFVNAVMRMKDLIVKECEIVDRDDDVWKNLSKILDNKLAPVSLFVMVKRNRHGVKDMLLGFQSNICNSEKRDISDSDHENFNDGGQDESYDRDSSLDHSKEPMKFDFFISRDEFESLVEFKHYEQSKGGRRRVLKRLWCVFRAGVYQDFFTKKIWETTHVRCGFLFQHSYVNMAQTSGTLAGKCFYKLFHIYRYHLL